MIVPVIISRILLSSSPRSISKRGNLLRIGACVIPVSQWCLRFEGIHWPLVHNQGNLRQIPYVSQRLIYIGYAMWQLFSYMRSHKTLCPGCFKREHIIVIRFIDLNMIYTFERFRQPVSWKPSASLNYNRIIQSISTFSQQTCKAQPQNLAYLWCTCMTLPNTFAVQRYTVWCRRNYDCWCVRHIQITLNTVGRGCSWRLLNIQWIADCSPSKRAPDLVRCTDRNSFDRNEQTISQWRLVCRRRISVETCHQCRIHQSFDHLPLKCVNASLSYAWPMQKCLKGQTACSYFLSSGGTAKVAAKPSVPPAL